MAHELEVEPGPDDLLVGTSAGAVIAGLLACGVSVDGIRRHQLGTPLPRDPSITFAYDSGTGGSLPPRPGLRPGSPRLAWGGIRRHRDVPALLALTGLLPAGRGTLEPVRDLVSGVISTTLPGRHWPDRETWIVTTDYATGRRTVFGRSGEPEADLADAVSASCAIPAWYAPVQIADGAYIDGGASSNASVDLVEPADFDEVFVFAPMAAVESDNPRSPVAMVERRVRRVITRALLVDVERLRAAGCRVTLLTPGPEDLETMGTNLMNPRRRMDVLRTSMRTAAVELRRRRRLAAPDGSEASIGDRAARP